MNLKLDENGDLDVSIGLQKTSSINQALSQRLKTFLGEWFLNQNDGFIDINTMYEKGADPFLLKSAVVDQALLVEGVNKVSGVSIEIDNSRREARISLKINDNENAEVVL
jgi:hypothetical protein